MEYAPCYARCKHILNLPHSIGGVLRQGIDALPYFDAVGCYSLLDCAKWKAFADGFTSLATNVVSMAIVADPFGDDTPEPRAQRFPDRAIPFKEHYVVNPARTWRMAISTHPRRNIRMVEKAVPVETTSANAALPWLALLSHENGQDGLWTRDVRPRRPGLSYMKEVSETIGPSRTS